MIISTQIAPIAKRIGYEKAGQFTKNAGFDAVDFGFCDYTSWGYCARGEGESIFSRNDEEILAFFGDIYSKLQVAGLAVGQTHAPFPSSRISGSSFEVTEENMRLARLSLRLTRLMDCDYCVIHPVFFGTCDYDREPELQKRFHEENIKFYSALIVDAKKYRVHICLENMWGSVERGVILPAVISHAPEMICWIDELNEAAGEEIFCACLDTGHACLTGDDPAEMVRALGKRLRRLHMHDVRENCDAHTLPFSGICKWEPLAQALKEQGYAGPLNFETVGFQDSKPTELLSAATTMLGAAAGYIRSLAE